MSLAKKIIFDTANSVAEMLHSGVEVNEIDEYGYTPLIETAIINSVSKADLLIKAGAEIDFPDLTGRTVLHWAVDNSNYELTELLLNNNANANAYTYAGQPVLAMPLLRKETKIKNLLLKNGANLSFAQDFISAKLTGHRFDLEGRVDIVDSNNKFIEVEFEGFYQQFSLEIVISSLKDFRKNFGGKHLRQYFSKLDLIIQSLQIAADLTKYQHYLIDAKKYTKKINRMLGFEPLVLPIAYQGHAINLIKIGEWLIRCDRGEFGRKFGTVIFYEMRNPHAFNNSFAKKLLYARQYRTFIDSGLEQYLDLVPRLKLPLTPQISGNCSWANVEAIVPALLFYFLADERKGEDLQDSKLAAMDFYHEWVKWDEERALYFAWEDFNEMDISRKASRAAMLAAILFQYCKYENVEDQKKAARILSVLAKPQFNFILHAYVKAFSVPEYKSYFENLHQFMDDFGVSIHDFA